MVILLITAQSNLSSVSRRGRKTVGIFSPQKMEICFMTLNCFSGIKHSFSFEEEDCGEGIFFFFP